MAYKCKICGRRIFSEKKIRCGICKRKICRLCSLHGFCIDCITPKRCKDDDLFTEIPIPKDDLKIKRILA